MRRAFALAAVFAAGCALGASALGDDGTGTTTGSTDTVPAATTTAPTDTTTTSTTSTTTTAATTTTTTTTTRPAPPPRIAARVTIGGVAVGGLQRARAYAAVRASFARPLPLVFQGRVLTAAPGALGAVAFAKHAVAVALHASPGEAVPLEVSVRPGPLRRYLRRLAPKLRRPPVDATLQLRGGRPFLTPDRPGAALEVEPALARVAAALTAGSRRPVRLPVTALEPKVTRRGFGSVVVIHRGANVLDLYRGVRLVRAFRVATGQAAYPTPLGDFTIVVKWKDPWWYPPASPWAAGEKPTPPGPGNPLGTRWMGLSAPGVGIHGTPDPGSIGYSLSHGCIRMLIPEAEWLFERVDIGTPVFIVAV